MARKKDILEAALVLFAEKDFHEVTVDEIAERVGLSKGTLYLYFKNKDDLFFSIIQEKTDVLFCRMRSALKAEESFLTSLESLIRTYLQFFEDHRHYFKIIHSEKTRMDVSDRNRIHKHVVNSYHQYERFLQDFMKEGQKQGVFRKLHPGILTKALRGLLNAFTFHCVFVGCKGSLEEEAPVILDLFLNGVKA